MAVRAPVVFSVLLACACSADAAPEPQPTLETAGAFVAVSTDTEEFELFRTLTVLGDGNEDDVLFFIRYAVLPQSFSEARALAQKPELPVASALSLIGKRYLHARDWRVVWFRSLTAEEQSSFR